MTQLALSDWQWSQVVSTSLLGGLVGIPISGFFVNKLSARFVLKLTALGFIFGAILCSSAHNVGALLSWRFIIGICVGVGSYIATLFIAEIAPPDRRVTLILMNGLSITFGQAMAYLIGYFLHDIAPASCRYLFLVGCIPASLLFLGMFFVPHSPLWLMKTKVFNVALSALKRIRAIEFDVFSELNEMQTNKGAGNTNYRILFKKPIIYVLFVGIALGIFQQG